jgi:DNA-directed RNA polymerase specialized sigma24 family protein
MSDEVDGLLALHESGVMINDLAAAFGISRTTVMSQLDRAGVERRSGVIDRHLAEAASLYDSGWSLATVAKHFNVDAGTVWRAFRRGGVPTRRRAGW